MDYEIKSANSQIQNISAIKKYEDFNQQPILELLNVADMAINRTYLPECVNCQIEKLDRDENGQLPHDFKSRTKLFQLKRFVYNPEENIMEKLKTFFLSLYHLPLDPSVFIIIKNKTPRGKRVLANYKAGEFSLHIGLRTESVEGSSNLQKMLKDSFCGTFLGSDLIETHIDQLDLQGDIKNLVCVSAMPSVKKDTDDETAKIGLEQFVDVMRSKNYTAVLIASPVTSEIIQQRKRDLENLYTRLSVNRKQTLQFGESESKSVSEGISDSTGVSSTTGKSFTETKSQGHSSTFGGGTSESYSYNSGSSSSMDGSSSSSGSGSSNSTSSNWSESDTWGVSHSTGTSETTGTNKNHSLSVNKGTTQGSSKSYSIECENKNVSDMMKKIDDTLKHISDSEAFGLWECAAYFTAGNTFDAMFAANNYRALVLGDSSAIANSYVNRWEFINTPPDYLHNENERQNFMKQQLANKLYINELFSYVIYGMHPHLTRREGGYYGNEQLFSSIMPTHAVSGRDLPYFLALPLKSVPGVVVDSIAAFERSVYTKSHADKNDENKKGFRLGSIYHMGQVETESEVKLSLDKLCSHTFISGSTGSGKSNTMSVILQGLIKNEVDFLIVEPAKGEYKQDFHRVKQKNQTDPINIFTTNPLCERLLHLNPFRFHQGIHVLEHIDRLLNIFGSCWELTAAMPAILKRSVEQAYENIGWDLGNSYFMGPGKAQYPTFATIVKELRNVIDSSDYSKEAKGNYTGALVTRVESLASGILRQIFCAEEDISYEILFDSRTIVDLSRLGSPETKTLIMGVLVMLLSEYRMAVAQETGATNSNLKHVTVLEEAHNLLKNANNTSGGTEIIAKSVEMISNAIAEMRTYGEGFIIVDQSPTAVDISAIKNTNTKIVMRLPEQHDCEAMANAMGLNEFQQKEIAKQGKGKAIVMQNDWTAAVMVAIDRASGNYSDTPELISRESNRQIRAELALAFADLAYFLYGYLFEISKSKEKRPYLNWDTCVSSHFIRHCNWWIGYMENLVDRPVRNLWDSIMKILSNAVNEFEASHGKFGIGKAKAKELSELCSCYAKIFDNSGISVMTVFQKFGKMVTALLQCETCWRKYSGNGAIYIPRHTAFQDSVAPYLRPQSEKMDLIHLQHLCMLITAYLEHGGIIDSGGTVEDVKKFREFRQKEQTTPKGMVSKNE